MRRVLIPVTAAMLVLYVAFDVFWPSHRNLRQFDPMSLGALETKMWRSYYERQRVTMFFELAEMLRTQYKFPLLRSYLAAYYGASAAFTFKEGAQRSDYESALPALEDYFGIIRNTGNIGFDVKRSAALELEWWIVHRERAGYPPGALGRACAEAAASVYMVPVDSTLEHGRLRAAAMIMRDERADAGRMTEADWAATESLLRQSYQSLHRGVAQPVALPAPE